MGITISIAIGLIYNLMVSKISNVVSENVEFDDKIQKHIIVTILGGIIALLLAFFVFGSEQFENKIVKHGLILGGSILLFYSTVYNWDMIQDGTKIFAMFGMIFFLILYSYKFIKNKRDNKIDLSDDN